MKLRPQSAAKIQFALIISAFCAGEAFVSVLVRAAAPQESPAKTSSVAEFEQQAKMQPKSAKAWSNLGAAQAMQGNCSAAMPALTRARALDPGLFSPWYFSGYCHLAFHEDRTALAELERATRLNPKDANGWYLEAESAANSKQLDLSLRAVARSLLLDAKRPESYYLAGQDALVIAKDEYDYVLAHQPSPYALRLRAERNAGQGVWAAAVADYQQARKLSPGAPDVAFGLGTVYLEKGDFAEAENEFRQCLETAPDSIWAKLRLALALAAQSKKDDAGEILKGIQPSELSSPTEWQDMIAGEVLLGQSNTARDLLGRAQYLYPDFPDWQDWSDRLSAAAPAQFSFEFEQAGMIGLPVSFLLSSRIDSGNYVRQIFPDSARYESFRKAYLSEDPSAAAALMPPAGQRPSDSARAFLSGEILQRAGLEFFERLEMEYPDSEPAMVLEAQNYSDHGDQAKAIEIYRAILKKNGPSPDILRNIASVYWKQHEWSEAVPSLEQLAKIDPYDPTTFINLGRIYFFQQDLKEAEKYFRMAMRIQPDMYEAHFGLGEVFQRMGEPKNAIPELKMAERAQPSNPRPHYFLSQVYRMTGEKDLAAEEMASFQRLQALSGTEGADTGSGLVPID